MPVLTPTKEMTRSEWLTWRKQGIGGSDAAAIAGLCRWKSPVAVYLEKIGEIEPEEAGEPAYWGQILEDIVAREFSVRTGLKVQRRNAILQHPDYPFMIANLDRLIIDETRGILECKTTSEWMKDEWDGKIPDQYMIQLQHYLAVTGLSYGYIAVLIGGNKFQYQMIERDEEIINYLTKIEADFWELVKSHTPPEMDGSQASSDLLKKLYPEGKPSETPLPLEAKDLIGQYQEAKEFEKKWSLAKDEAGNKLKAMLEEHEVGIIGDMEVRWKTVKTSKFDSKAFKQDHQDLYEKYTKPSSYRRFEIKG